MPDAYRVDIRPAARRELESLGDSERARVAEAIAALTWNPRPRGCRKLATSDDDYRLRIGDYRVLYEVTDARKTILVYRIRHRSSAYK